MLSIDLRRLRRPLRQVACLVGLLFGGATVLAAGSVCGNGIVESGEQCDDGGLLDLDGCTRTCRYEAIQRLDSLAIAGATAPSYCAVTTNAFGGAFSSQALPTVNGTLQDAVDTDQLILLLDLLGLDDAAGQNDDDLEVGLLGATRDSEDPNPGGLDDWYLVAEDLLDPNGMPVERLSPGSITALELNAGPTTVSLPFLDGGALTLRDGAVRALVSAAVSSPAPPPTALAPGLMAFETLDGSADGLCGNATVGSLAVVPVPSVPCNAACSNSRSYVGCGGGPVTTACHSLLDLLVGGCRTDLVVPNDCLIEVVEPTQPDVGVGANPPAVLTFGPSGGGINKVSFSEPDDAYSSWFTFTSERAHATNNLGVVFRDGFESGDLLGWTAASP